jgi:hypothetical protein
MMRTGPGTKSHEGRLRRGGRSVQPQAWRSTREHTGERGLAHIQWVAAQIVAVELDQVEGKQEHAAVMVLVPDAIEGCDLVVTARHSLPVDDAGA